MKASEDCFFASAAEKDYPTPQKKDEADIYFHSFIHLFILSFVFFLLFLYKRGMGECFLSHSFLKGLHGGWKLPRRGGGKMMMKGTVRKGERRERDTLRL